MMVMFKDTAISKLFPLPAGERVGSAQNWSGEGAADYPYPPHPTATKSSASLHWVFVSLSPMGRGTQLRTARQESV